MYKWNISSNPLIIIKITRLAMEEKTLSDTSSILHNHQTNDAKMKKKVIEDDELIILSAKSSSQVNYPPPPGLNLSFLDQKFSNKYNLGGSEVELRLFNAGGSASKAMKEEEASDESAHDKRSSSERRVFSCNFCRKEFSTSQALGGHQNAHKQERAMVKHRRELGLMGGVHHQYPLSFYNQYYSSSTLPHHASLYGLYGNRSSLGVRMESIIRKPSIQWSPYGYRFGASEKSSQGLYNNLDTFKIQQSINPNLANGLQNPNSSSLGGSMSTTTGLGRIGGLFKPLEASSSTTSSRPSNGLSKDETELDLTLKL